MKKILIVAVVASVLVGIYLSGSTIEKADDKKTEENEDIKPIDDDPNQGEQDLRACTMDYTPVCGFDGKTYSNSCMAGDVEIDYEGECKKEQNTPEIKPPIKPCTREYMPVCGVDGKTYSNSCTAGDVEIAHTGECEKSNEKNCLENGGIWIESANECEGISKEVCDSIGGEFNECGSACRNDPNAEICTMQCVIYCKL